MSSYSKPRTSPKRHLGQNFLTSPDICKKIVLSSSITSTSHVLEVGGGRGILTKEIMVVSKNLTIIEKDCDCIPILQNIATDATIVNADAMYIDLKTITPTDGQIDIIANLPYNVGTLLLYKWLGELEHIKSITVMLQKEVVERLLAKPQTSDYSKLSVLFGTFFTMQKVMNVSAGSFFPKPKVESAVINMTNNGFYNTLNNHNEYISDLTKTCNMLFSHKRKTLGAIYKLHPELSVLMERFSKYIHWRE